MGGLAEYPDLSRAARLTQEKTLPQLVEALVAIAPHLDAKDLEWGATLRYFNHDLQLAAEYLGIAGRDLRFFRQSKRYPPVRDAVFGMYENPNRELAKLYNEIMTIAAELAHESYRSYDIQEIKMINQKLSSVAKVVQMMPKHVTVLQIHRSESDRGDGITITDDDRDRFLGKDGE